MKKGFLVLAGLAVLVLAFNFLIFSGGDKGVTGNVVAEGRSQVIEIKGSDTIVQLVSNLAEAYSFENKDARVSVTGGGSGTGIASLINGEVDIADSSRKIKDEELGTARKTGLEPVEVIIAIDMLSVIVNEENSVSKLTKEQVGKIFRGEIKNWKEVGGEDSEITLYGRQSTSGTYAFFLEEVVNGKHMSDEGEYSSAMRNLEGNQAILEAVKQDRSGVGYVGIGYIVDENKKVVSGIKVAEVSNGGKYYSPLDESTMLDYPISRGLYQYLAEKPAKNSPIYEFVMFELSEEGQSIVEDSGFIKITEEFRKSNEAVLA